MKITKNHFMRTVLRIPILFTICMLLISININEGIFKPFVTNIAYLVISDCTFKTCNNFATTFSIEWLTKISNRPRQADSRLLFAKGRIETLQGSFLLANKNFRNALKFDPNNPLINYELGNTFYRLNEINNAIYYWEKSGANLQEAVTLTENGFSELNQGKSKKAYELFKWALVLNPSSATAYNGLGKAIMDTDKSRWQEAINYYLKAIQYAPNVIENYNRIGDIFKDQKLYDLAKSWYQKSIDVNNNNEWAFIGMGEISLIQKDDDSAERFFNDALRINNRNFWAHYEMAQTYKLKGDISKSITEYLYSQEIDPLHVETYINLGDLYMTMGASKNAYCAYKCALNLSPSNKEVIGKITTLIEVTKQTGIHCEICSYNSQK